MSNNEKKRDGYVVSPSSVRLACLSWMIMSSFASYQPGQPVHYTSFSSPLVLSACDDEKGVPEFTPVVPSNRVSQKRDSGVEVALAPPVKRGFPTDAIMDALLQTTVPEVLNSGSSVPEETVDVLLGSLTPTLDYFSNEIMFYNNGVLERQTNPVSLPSFVNLEETESEADTSATDFVSEDEPSDMDGIFEVHWNDEEDDRDNVTSECLYGVNWVCECRKDYACPVCYETPVSPVSTICGHVFCRNCIKRLFMVSVRLESDW